MPNRKANVKNEKQYEALTDKGMSKERAARIANSPGASIRGGKVPFVELALELEPGRNDRAEESSGPQGRPRRRTEVLVGISDADRNQRAARRGRSRALPGESPADQSG